MSIFLGFLVSKFVHALSAARYWATVEGIILEEKAETLKTERLKLESGKLKC